MSTQAALLVGGGETDLDRDRTKKEAKEANHILWHVCSFILIVETCERLAFYTFSSTLTLYFIQLGTDGVQASQMTSLFNALVFLTPLLGGYIGDEILNRFKTIVVFTLLYLIGLAMMTAASYPSISNYDLSLVALLLFIAVGAGGIKSNVVTLGGDQFRDNSPAHVAARSTFFAYFYWAVNTGALIANAYLNNLAFNPVQFSGGTIPYEYGYFMTFAIPLGVLGIAFAVFIAGSSRYTIKEVQGSAISDFCRAFGRIVPSTGCVGLQVMFAIVLLLVAAIITITSYFVEDTSMAKWMDVCSMLMIMLGSLLFVVHCRSVEWLEKHGTGGQSLNSQGDSFELDASATSNVKDVLLLLPYFGMLAVFWLCYNQMFTNFILQGCQMNNLIGGIAFSPSFFSSFDTVTILIAIPLVDNFVYPVIERKREGRKLRALSKMQVGFFCICLAMLVAAVVEHFRSEADIAGYGVVATCCKNCSFFSASGNTECDSDNACGTTEMTNTMADGTPIDPVLSWKTCEYNSACNSVGGFAPLADMTVWWQIIQYSLVGFGEVFTSVSAYELFYDNLAPEMRSVGQGVNLLTSTYGAFAAGGLNAIFVDWLPTNLDDDGAHLDWLFYIIAGLTFLTGILFVWVKRSYIYRDERDQAGHMARVGSSRRGSSVTLEV